MMMNNPFLQQYSEARNYGGGGLQPMQRSQQASLGNMLQNMKTNNPSNEWFSGTKSAINSIKNLPDNLSNAYNKAAYTLKDLMGVQGLDEISNVDDLFEGADKAQKLAEVI